MHIKHKHILEFLKTTGLFLSPPVMFRELDFAVGSHRFNRLKDCIRVVLFLLFDMDLTIFGVTCEFQCRKVNVIDQTDEYDPCCQNSFQRPAINQRTLRAAS